MHLPVEAQRPSTSMGLHGTAVFSVSKVDGHWIMLRLCPSHGRSASLGVNGEWAGLDAGILRDDERVFKRLSCHLINSDFELQNIAGALSPIADFASESKDKLYISYTQFLVSV